MWTRSLLKIHAKENFKRNYWRTVLASLVLAICVGTGTGITLRGNLGSMAGGTFTVGGYQNNPMQGVFSGMSPSRWEMLLGFFSVLMFIMFIAMLIGLAIRIFLLNPLEVGCRRYFLDNHNEPATLGNLGFAFENRRYGNITKTQFLRVLYTFLWGLLFVIPGIIKRYSYRFVPYILADDPGMDANEAITLSRQLMDGNKWRAFVLDLSFILWELLNMFTFGILDIFWVTPYRSCTDAELYLVIRYGIANPVHTGSAENVIDVEGSDERWE